MHMHSVRSLSGDELAAAQDDEAIASEDLIAAPTVHLGEIGDKLAAVADMMELGAWSDRREVRLLKSIGRDLKRAARVSRSLFFQIKRRLRLWLRLAKSSN